MERILDCEGGGGVHLFFNQLYQEIIKCSSHCSITFKRLTKIIGTFILIVLRNVFFNLSMLCFAAFIVT